jgi:RHS repeat-associated protein
VVSALLIVVVLQMSGLGTSFVGVVHAKAQPPTDSQDSSRFTPYINAPQLPTARWTPPTSTAPHLQSHPATGKSAVSGRGVGEQADLRTAASSTFLNSDGTWTLQSYPVPVHYQDAQGNWQSINSAVVADNSVSGYGYGNSANSWRVHFAQRTGGPKLLHLQYPGLTVSESLDGAAAASATTSGSQVTYPGVFPGVDLHYLVGNASLEETLLLRNAQTPGSYTFTYHVPGATARQDDAGNILFLDKNGNLLLTVGNIAMYESDAQGQMLPNGQGTSNVAVTLAGSSPNYTLTLTPDHAWLTDPSRHFPVAIDPTFSGADSHTNTTSGNTYADTFDESANPTWGFYTTNTERIGNCNAIPSGSTGYGTGTNRSYIKFPVGAAPAGVRVTSATLSLYQLSAFGGGPTIAADEIKTAWNATTLTWNNHPTNAVMVGSAAARTTYNVTWQVDVTQALYDWWENGQTNNGLRLRYTNESAACNLFSSDDRGITSELPSLTVNYVQDLTAPGAALTINGGATVTNNPAVRLNTTVSDTGSITEWGSNWTSATGVGANGGSAAHWVATGSELTADTSSCGATQCSAQTFIPSNASSWSNIANWPTFTAMFKSDLAGTFYFGAVASGSENTRFDLVASAGSSAFTSLQYSTAAGSYSTTAINVPFTANTWYYGQVAFPQNDTAEIYVWPVGQAKPATPTVMRAGIYMSQPGLNFWEDGDSGANLHTYSIANVVATAKNTGSGTIGYGVYGMDFSNDGSTWSCPTGGSWCVAAASQPTWTLSSGDGAKTVRMRAIDNVGKVSSTASAVIVYDTTAPTATITSPTAARDARGVVTVNGVASDPTAADGSSSGVASVALYVDGIQEGMPVTASTTPSFLWDTTNVASGPHTLTLKATDNAGNTGAASAGVLVSVSNGGQMSYETYALRDLPAGGVKAGVNVATGTSVVTEQDIDVSGRGPDLALGRDYSDLSPINNLFGWGWTSDLDEALQLNADNSVTYRDASGGFHVFLPNGQGGYTTPPGVFLTLTHNQDGSFTLTARDQTKTNFNAAGYLTSVVDRKSNTLTVAYDAFGDPATMTDSSGRTLTFTTTGGHITHIAAPGSRTFDYGYDASGNLTDYTDPQGIVTHYDYDASHRMTKITLNYQSGGPSDVQTNVATTLSYDSANRLVTLVDPMGFDAGISYGAPGAWSTTVQQLWTNANTTPPSGSSVYQSTTYTAANDGSGAVTRITDALNNSAFSAYNANGQLTQLIDPNGNTTTFTYDGNGNLLSRVVDPGSGRLALTTSWTYDSANNALTRTDPRGIVTKYTYDTPATANVTTTVQHYVSGGPTNSDTNVTSSATYDSFGEALTNTDALGVVTKYTYDSYGDVLTTTENYQQGVTPDDHTNVTTSATYDDLGEQLTTTNALGVVTAMVYDIRGNALQTTANYQSGGPSDDHTNVQTQYGYDALGRQITTTNPRGIVTKSVYDKDGREIQTIANYVNGGSQDSQTNVTTTTAYDGAGNATVATDAKGNTTTTTYDADNRAIETKIAGNGGAQVQDTKTTYDAAGAKVSSQVIDGDNNPTTTYTYDAANRPLTQSDPPANPGASDQSGQSNVTTYTYDANGATLETKVTNDALTGSVSDTTATFDALGRQLTKTEDADTGSPRTTTYVYDAGGQQSSMTDEANKTTSTSYDALGRVVSVTNPDSTVDTTTYNAAGEKLTQSNSAGTTTDTYDALGRVSTEQRKNGSGVLQGTVAYTYDTNGNVTQKVTTLADNSQVTTVSTYDALDRQATMDDGTRSYSYDLAGNISHMQVLVSGSGYAVQSDYGYDGGNRLTSLSDKVGPSATTLHTYSYTYDGNGNRSSIVEDSATTTNYTYDDLSQLTQVQSGSTVTATYAYDANHNRTSLVTPSGATNYSYDSSDKLTQKTDPNGKVTTYGYDTQGNLTSATYDPTGVNQVTQYHYDANGRLTEIDKPDATTIQFGYDADYNRTTKTITNSGVSHSVNDVYVLGHLAYETDQNGTVLATFTYDSMDAPVSVQVGSDPNTAPRYYYVYNGHGDVVALVDAQGNTAASYSYDAFGQVTAFSENFGGNTTWTNPYRYDGRDGVRYDGETGLYWMSVRAYDPALGRFLSRDPLGRVPLFFSDQPYTYAGNNPLINVDPSGQRFMAAEGVQTSKHVTSPATRVIPQQGCDKACKQRKAKDGFGGHIAPALLAFAGLMVSGISFIGDVLSLANEIIGKPMTLDLFMRVIDKVLKVSGSFLGVVAQGLNLGSRIWGWQINGLLQWIHGAAALVNTVAALWKPVRNLIQGGWRLLAEASVAVVGNGLNLLVQGEVGAIPGLVKFLAYMVGRVLGVDLLSTGIRLLGQALSNAIQAYVAHVNTLTPAQFCSAWYTKPFQAGC